MFGGRWARYGYGEMNRPSCKPNTKIWITFKGCIYVIVTGAVGVGNSTGVGNGKSPYWSVRTVAGSPRIPPSVELYLFFIKVRGDPRPRPTIQPPSS
jgi:hypothetical protein